MSGYDVYLACPRVQEIMTEVSEIILTYFTDHNYVTVSAQNNFTVIA